MLLRGDTETPATTNVQQQSNVRHCDVCAWFDW